VLFGLNSLIPPEGINEVELAAKLQVSIPLLRACLENSLDLALEESVDIFPHPADSSRATALYNRKWRKK
jgi:hypothetical protein